MDELTAELHTPPMNKIGLPDAYADALRAIAEGYPVRGEHDRYVVVENPHFREDDGSDPNLCIDTYEHTDAHAKGMLEYRIRDDFEDLCRVYGREHAEKIWNDVPKEMSE